MGGVVLNMKIETLPAPGIVFGSYPERRPSKGAVANRHASGVADLLRASPTKCFMRDVQLAQKRREELVRLSDAERE